MAQINLTTRQVIVGLFAFFGMIVSVGANMAVSFKSSRGPLTPDPAHGLVVPVHDHQTIHYITKAFDTWASVAVGAQFLFMAILALVVASIWFKKSAAPP